MSNRQVFFIMVSIGFFLGFADSAFAGTAIKEFSGPIDKIVATLTGPVGKGISIIAMALTGVAFWLKKGEVDDGIKNLLGVAFAISFIAFAAQIIDFMFPFSSGAIL